jgi:hypothetical protein
MGHSARGAWGLPPVRSRKGPRRGYPARGEGSASFVCPTSEACQSGSKEKIPAEDQASPKVDQDYTTIVDTNCPPNKMPPFRIVK